MLVIIKIINVTTKITVVSITLLVQAYCNYNIYPLSPVIQLEISSCDWAIVSNRGKDLCRGSYYDN